MIKEPNVIACPDVTLNDGNRIPQLGFGLSIRPDRATATVLEALDAGYRLVDTAAGYRTESGVREALRSGRIERHDVFITTKLSHHGREAAFRGLGRSLRKLGTEYLDLYLIHFPFPEQDRYLETWQALTELQAAGRARSIGVSNFRVEHLRRLIDRTGVVPAVNQVQLHPHFQQADLRRFHSEHGIVTEAYSPLGQGGSVRDPVIQRLAAAYRRTAAQIILRWHMQLGNVAIPRSMMPSRLRENIRIFDFELTTGDMASLGQLDTGQRLGPDPTTGSGASGARRAILELAESYPVIDPVVHTARRALTAARGLPRGH